MHMFIFLDNVYHMICNRNQNMPPPPEKHVSAFDRPTSRYGDSAVVTSPVGPAQNSAGLSESECDCDCEAW